MKRLLVLFVIFGLALCGVAQAQNELANPSFEDIAVPMDPDPIVPTDAANWNEFMSANGVSQRVTTMPRTGDASMELIVDGANGFAGVFQTLQREISPGAVVTLSGYHKSLDQPFGATRELKIEWIGAPQLRVDEFVIGPDYEQFSLTGQAPAGTTGATITYAVSTFGTGQSFAHVHLDDFDVRVIPEPATVMLLGLAAVGLVGLRRRR